MQRFTHRSVIVTGGGSGLGRTTAEMFAAEGANVLVADLAQERLDQTVEEIHRAGGVAESVLADVSDEDQVAAMVDRAVTDYGGLDVLHANAGVAERGMGMVPIEEIPLQDWQLLINVDLTGAFLSIKHAVRAMKAQRSGAVVVTSSAAAFAAYPGWTAYTAAKHGVTGLVKAAALSAGRLGIRVNAICPAHGMSEGFTSGAATTQSHEQAWSRDERWDPWNSEIPLKLDHAPTPRDSANLALFLASDDAAYISGDSFPVTDGGTLGKVALTIPSHLDQKPAE